MPLREQARLREYQKEPKENPACSGCKGAKVCKCVCHQAYKPKKTKK